MNPGKGRICNVNFFKTLLRAGLRIEANAKKRTSSPKWGVGMALPFRRTGSKRLIPETIEISPVGKTVFIRRNRAISAPCFSVEFLGLCSRYLLPINYFTIQR